MQTGVVTTMNARVTLSQPYKDTSGIVLVTPKSVSAPPSGAGNPRGGFISNSQIFVSSADGSAPPAFWRTEGYIR